MDARRLHRLVQSKFLPLRRIALSSSSQLETDPALLIPKARAALERYGHQIVIGNDLNTRKHEVVFVSRPSSSPSPPLPPATHPATPAATESWIRIDPHAVDARGRPREIEEDIVAELVQRHDAWVASKS